MTLSFFILQKTVLDSAKNETNGDFKGDGYVR